MRQHLWQQHFQEYQFDIEHIKGKNNHLADFLSKGTNGPDVSDDATKDIKVLLEMTIHEVYIT